MVRSLKWILVILLFCYAAARVYTVSITHDEAYSYFLVKTNYLKAMGGTANTHWLNSLGMKLGSLLLGDQPWQLRLFSVAAWLLYGYSAIRLSEKIQNTLLSFAFFIALVVNPFLLDFFSLARGYGLTCAFTITALWKAVDAVDRKAWQLQQWVPAVCFASAAVFSNYTSLYFFIALVLGFVAGAFRYSGWQQFWPLRINTWTVVVAGTGAVAIGNLFFIKYYTGDLEYGGEADFMQSVFGSLVEASLYTPTSAQTMSILTYAGVALVAGSLLYAAFRYVKTRQVTAYIFTALTVLLILFLILFFHVAFGTPYLLARTTLMLYPCLVTLVFYFINESTRLVTGNKIVALLIGLPLIVAFSYNFLASANLRYCYEWKFNAGTRQLLEQARKDGAQKVLINYWIKGVYVNYYSVAEKGTYNFDIHDFRPEAIAALSEPFCHTFQTCDHAILLPPYNLEAMRAKGLRFQVLARYPVTGGILLRIQPTNQIQ